MKELYVPYKNREEKRETQETIAEGLEWYQEQVRPEVKAPEESEELTHDLEEFPLPDGFIDPRTIGPQDDRRDGIYYAYSRAMSRRNREPLDQFRFERHFFEGGSAQQPVGFGDDRRGYILGIIDSQLGIFTPTHFAPLTMRGGYNLLQELGSSHSVPAILAITEDLKDTLRKMPSWHTLDLVKFKASFHTGQQLEKEIMYNDYFTTPEGQQLAMQVVARYLEGNFSAKQLSNQNQEPGLEQI